MKFEIIATNGKIFIITLNVNTIEEAAEYIADGVRLWVKDDNGVIVFVHTIVSMRVV